MVGWVWQNVNVIPDTQWNWSIYLHLGSLEGKHVPCFLGWPMAGSHLRLTLFFRDQTNRQGYPGSVFFRLTLRIEGSNPILSIGMDRGNPFLRTYLDSYGNVVCRNTCGSFPKLSMRT